MAMKITIVVDNMVAPSSGPFLAEHGFSVLLETGGKRILVDTGQSGIVVDNLGLLGIHCKDLDAVVLSHGHFDHTGGLSKLLKQRKEPIPVYAHTGVFDSHYARKGDCLTYAGIPHLQAELTSKGAVWQLFDEPVEIVPGLWFSGSIPRLSGFETGDQHLVTVDRCGCHEVDQVQDDSALYYTSDQGLVVISGCAHSGLINTVRYGWQVTATTGLQGWVGGTHLGPVTAEQLEKTLQFLDQQHPAFIAAGHCTGFKVMAMLHQRLQERFIPSFIGTVIECK